jgi:hypothetical protein
MTKRWNLVEPIEGRDARHLNDDDGKWSSLEEFRLSIRKVITEHVDESTAEPTKR